MGIGTKLRQTGNKIVDGLIGLTSGSVPSATLDSPRAFGLVSIVAVVAIVFSGWLVYRSIHDLTKLRQLPTTASAVAQLDKLKKLDTDGDGLSDYDELFTYKSSPYLWSSAGDGISDGDKIKRGLDPNCPVNKVCNQLAINPGPLDQNGQLTPAYLRQALRASGVPASTLDTMTDAEITSIYQQVIGAQTNDNTGGSVAGNGNTNNSLTNLSYADLQNMKATDVRKLLQDSGIDPASLNKLDDATLQAIFQKALQANTNTNSNTNSP